MIEDDEYNGFYIPKGSTVIANISCADLDCSTSVRLCPFCGTGSHILHDPAVYADPLTFNPDRYLPTADNPEGEPSPTRAVFGFGRR